MKIAGSRKIELEPCHAIQRTVEDAACRRRRRATTGIVRRCHEAVRSSILERGRADRSAKEENDGNQAKRLAAVRQRTGRVVHRHGPHRPAVPGRPSPARGRRRQRHVRARRAHGVAHASARPDADRDGRLRLGAARGRADRGDPAGRRRLVPARREALARRHADHGDDAHRHSGSSSTARPSTGWSRSATSNTKAVERTDYQPIQIHHLALSSWRPWIVKVGFHDGVSIFSNRMPGRRASSPAKASWPSIIVSWAPRQ